MASQADIGALNVSDSFSYKTQKTVAVNIQVNTASPGEQTNLTFFGQTAKGLKLLGSSRVNGSGHYTGNLLIPTHIKNLVVKSRWLNSFQESNVTINKNKITATIDQF